MPHEEVSALVETAIDLLIEHEPELLTLGVTERTLSFHLARYLTDLVPAGYNVDCEYNRHFDDPKRLNLPRRTALDREMRATTVFPDVLVHKRNTDKYNLLVLELKKPGEDIEYDEIKLRAFRNELHYTYAAHVIVGRQKNGQVIRQVIWIDG